MKCKFGFIAAMAFLAAGCAPKAVVLRTEGVEPAADYGDLAAVLAEAVDKDGLLDPEALAGCRERLDEQLRRLAVTGPTATPRLLPEAEDRLAYWYNARAAWAMKLALLEKCPATLPWRRLCGRRFALDGRSLTLAGIDAAIEAESGWLAVVAAPGVRLDRAPLPAEPFAAAGIRRRIAGRFNELLDDPRRFVIDIKRKKVLVPLVLWRFRKRLIEQHNRIYRTRGAGLTAALLPYVAGSAHRRLQDAVGYRCRPSGRLDLLALIKRD